MAIADNLQNLRFYQRSSATIIDHTMFRTKIRLPTQKTTECFIISKFLLAQRRLL